MSEQEVTTQRSSKGLADALFEEFDLLRNGRSTPQMARAKASIAGGIMSLTRLEMDYARFVSEARSGGQQELAALPMGSTAPPPAVTAQ